MDAETRKQVKEVANTLLNMGMRIGCDVDLPDNYELLLAMTNQAGQAVAMLRAALESVPESQR